jgi:hypothetical protein
MIVPPKATKSVRLRTLSALARNAPPHNQLTFRTRIIASGKENRMDSVIYLVGLIVVVMFILSALGLR